MTGEKNQYSKRQAWLLTVLALILVNLIVGAITFRSYGDSLDEPRFREYAGQSLAAYTKWLRPSYVPDFGGDDLRYYGPAYAMEIRLIVRLLGLPATGPLAGDVWHLAGFITFQGAVLCFFFLARRWLSHWASFGMALLFATQPLLWGHAFINPKDSPFLAFFLASVLIGLWMCDKLLTPLDKLARSPFSLRTWLLSSKQAWQKMPRRSKVGTLVAGAIWFVSIIFLLGGKGYIDNWIVAVVEKWVASDPLSLAGRLFGLFSNQAGSIPLENYIRKAQTLFGYIRNTYFIVGTLLILWIYRVLLPWSIHTAPRTALISFLRGFGRSLITPPVILAGLVLGLTTSVRVLGPLAGLIVGLYALWRGGWKMLASLLAYALIGLVVMYLTWPYLWAAPVKNFIESLNMMSAFPWLGRVLYNGVYYSPNELPWSYLPVLLTSQFTEPVIVLFWAGLAIAAYNLLRHRDSELLGIASVWLVIPLVLIIATRRPLYDNFRQILFLVPPIFLLGGIALERLFQLVRKAPFILATVSLLILPGIVSSIVLHPYEYIYYNSLVGGVKGAFRRYESDYWMTSFREAAMYLNKTAEPDARIVSWIGAPLVQIYSRVDLLVEPEQGNTYDLTGGYNYAVLSSRGGDDEVYPDVNPVFIVERQNAILAVVKHLSPDSSP